MEGYPTLSTNVLPVLLVLVRKTGISLLQTGRQKEREARAICPLTVSNSAGIWRRNTDRKPSRDPLLSDAWLYKRKCHDNTEINNFTTIKHLLRAVTRDKRRKVRHVQTPDDTAALA